MNDQRQHWDHVYGTKPETEVSWHQPRPELSLKLIRAAAPDPATAIIDVGCGAATLIGELAAAGYRDLTGLDGSTVALEKARAVLGEAAGRVTWIVADAAGWSPERHWGVWHDRAVFHFLTEPEAQDAYIRAMSAALAPGARAIMATFALDGPDRCSGLPVRRYNAATMAERLGPGFRLVSETHERHVTPKGVVQNFTYVVSERRQGSR